MEIQLKYACFAREIHRNTIVFPLYFYRISTVFLFLCCFCFSVYAEEALSWQDCVKEAAKNHPDLIAAEEVVKQSEAGKKITASTLYPQVSTNLSASTARNDNGITNTVGDAYNYGVEGSQLIFDGTKTVNNVRAASENIKASKEAYRFTSTDVRLRLRTAFINLLKAQESLRISGDIYKIRSKNLGLIMLRYRSGLEHKGALLTAEANLAQAKLGIVASERSVNVARRQLAKEMGKIETISTIAKGDFNIKESLEKKPDLELLAKNNPSLRQLIAQANAAEFGVKSAYADFWPTVSASAGAGKNDSHWSPKSDEWNLGLTLTLPVFEGGLRVAQVEQAKASLGQTKAKEKSTRDSIIFTLEQAWAGLEDTVDNVKVQRELLTATEERSKIAQAQYSIGFISFDNWTIIEDNLVSAKRTLLNAQADALLAEASWVKAKGETLEYE
ncbi:MAG: TolC family protein [Candidatus Omnitrophota bacterium]|jgi:outer membrane protein TolC